MWEAFICWYNPFDANNELHCFQNDVSSNLIKIWKILVRPKQFLPHCCSIFVYSYFSSFSFITVLLQSKKPYSSYNIQWTWWVLDMLKFQVCLVSIWSEWFIQGIYSAAYECKRNVLDFKVTLNLAWNEHITMTNRHLQWKRGLFCFSAIFE